MKKKLLTGLTSGMLLVGLSGVAQASLLHQYEFSSGLQDAIGGANGTLLNGATVSDGVLNLDGHDDYAQFSAHLVPTSGSYTVALFAKQNAGQNGYVEMISQGYSGGPGFYIGKNTNNTVRVSDSWIATGIAFPEVGIFHHYAVSVDAANGNSSLYIDGSLAASRSGAITTTSAGTDTRLGSQFSYHGEYFNGVLDDVRIYDTALSSTQIANLANNHATPEPATLLLLGSGLAGLIGARRRKKA